MFLSATIIVGVPHIQTQPLELKKKSLMTITHKIIKLITHLIILDIYCGAFAPPPLIFILPSNLPPPITSRIFNSLFFSF